MGWEATSTLRSVTATCLSWPGSSRQQQPSAGASAPAWSRTSRYGPPLTPNASRIGATALRGTATPSSPPRETVATVATSLLPGVASRRLEHAMALSPVDQLKVAELGTGGAALEQAAGQQPCPDDPCRRGTADCCLLVGEYRSLLVDPA